MNSPDTPDAGTSGTEQHAEISAIHARLDAGDARMARIEKSLAANTAATKRVETNTSDLVDLFISFKGAFKVLEGLGKIAKPVAAVVGLGAALLSLWAAFKGIFK